MTADVLAARAPLTRRPHPARGMAAFVAAWLKRKRNAYRWRRELAGMTDRELSDMGITRGEIGPVADGALTRTMVDNFA